MSLRRLHPAIKSSLRQCQSIGNSIQERPSSCHRDNSSLWTASVPPQQCYAVIDIINGRGKDGRGTLQASSNASALGKRTFSSEDEQSSGESSRDASDRATEAGSQTTRLPGQPQEALQSSLAMHSGVDETDLDEDILYESDSDEENITLPRPKVVNTPEESIAKDTIDQAGKAASEVMEAATHAAEMEKAGADAERQSMADQATTSGQSKADAPNRHAAGSDELQPTDIEVGEWESIVADKWVTDMLERSDIGSYMGLPRDLLPEVFFADELPAGEELHPKGGCRGLEEEIEASGTDLILYRESIYVLATEVAAKASKKMYLVGPSSSGKSIAMATVVVQLRALGWLVMYIPEAKQLTSGGFFNRHATEEGRWDTPEVAKLILHYLLEGNPGRMEQERSPRSGENLAHLARQAIDSTDPQTVVDLFLEVKEGVAAASNALIAIDNYQALYVPTEYGEWLSPTKRRALEPDELRVASAMKVLEQDPLGDGVVLCAAQRSSSFSPRMRLPLEHGATTFTIPRLNFAEWTAMADFYGMTGATATLSDYAIKKAYFTMAANPKEFRKYAPLISADEDEPELGNASTERQPAATA